MVWYQTILETFSLNVNNGNFSATIVYLRLDGFQKMGTKFNRKSFFTCKLKKSDIWLGVEGVVGVELVERESWSTISKRELTTQEGLYWVDISALTLFPIQKFILCIWWDGRGGFYIYFMCNSSSAGLVILLVDCSSGLESVSWMGLFSSTVNQSNCLGGSIVFTQVSD